MGLINGVNKWGQSKYTVLYIYSDPIYYDCYGCSGEKQGKSRSQCDSEFLEGMKGMCRFLPNPIACMGVAYSYYAGVRAFGGSDFTDGRKEDCGCE
jgi:hypothetical protein